MVDIFLCLLLYTPFLGTIDPFAPQLPESVQVCSFSLSDPMTCSNGKEVFEGRTLTDFFLSPAYMYREFSIAPNRIL